MTNTLTQYETQARKLNQEYQTIITKIIQKIKTKPKKGGKYAHSP